MLNTKSKVILISSLIVLVLLIGYINSARNSKEIIGYYKKQINNNELLNLIELLSHDSCNNFIFSFIKDGMYIYTYCYENDTRRDVNMPLEIIMYLKQHKIDQVIYNDSTYCVDYGLRDFAMDYYYLCYSEKKVPSSDLRLVQKLEGRWYIAKSKR